MRLIRIFYRNERQNVLFDMDVCDEIGVTYYSRMALIRDDDGTLLLEVSPCNLKEKADQRHSYEKEVYEEKKVKFDDASDIRERIHMRAVENRTTATISQALFRRAEEYCKSQDLSRDRLYALALEHFLNGKDKEGVEIYIKQDKS